MLLNYMKGFWTRDGVPKYLVHNGCKTSVALDGELLESFLVQVGVHQVSALRPLLFIIITDVLTEDVGDSSLLELLHSDDLILCDESVEEVMENYG